MILIGSFKVYLTVRNLLGGAFKGCIIAKIDVYVVTDKVLVMGIETVQGC